jgi:coenzyme F420 hydrogenase subunit beta
VDGILTMGQDVNDAWKPVPILITQEEDIALARGMKMGYAPLLALLDNAKELGLKKLAVIGIPCQIYALRTLEKELGFEKIYVIGTPCSDNTTTENFHEFLSIIDPEPKSITYLEFKANYHVELRYQNGKKKEIPFLMLPLSKLRPDFFPTTCRTCVDYTNSLADITIGYMGGNGEQWVIVRNDRGQELIKLLEGEIKLQAPIDSGKRMGAVKGFMKNTELAAGGLPLRQMPDWLRPIVGWLMPKVGPKGIEFARARVEMKAIETALILRQQMPKKMKHMVPQHIWLILEKYGITPNPEELPK